MCTDHKKIVDVKKNNGVAVLTSKKRGTERIYEVAKNEKIPLFWTFRRPTINKPILIDLTVNFIKNKHLILFCQVCPLNQRQ